MKEAADPRDKYASEADLCSDFIAALPEGWVAYPETADWDILLVRSADGTQVGIQAKQRFNAEVVEQALEQYWNREVGPDYRAVLVPPGAGGSALHRLCSHVGLTIIRMEPHRHRYRNHAFRPDLPAPPGDWRETWQDREWFEQIPLSRHKLPGYVPDVKAGASAPLRLTDWKIKAIKIQILLEKRGYLTRADFKALSIDIRRWISGGQYASLIPNETKTRWVRNGAWDYRRGHPKNYAEIEADFDEWSKGIV